MTEQFAHFVRDATGRDFLFTIAGPDYAERFRPFAQAWKRLKHDPKTGPSAGPITVHVIPSSDYKPQPTEGTKE